MTAVDETSNSGAVYQACERIGAAPIVPVRQTLFVKRGDHLAPTCDHSTWTFAGFDSKHGASMVGDRARKKP